MEEGKCDNISFNNYEISIINTFIIRIMTNECWAWAGFDFFLANESMHIVAPKAAPKCSGTIIFK